VNVLSVLLGCDVP